jgi:hypothetical protein
MMIGSAFLMIIFSLVSKPPSQATIDRYFGPITAGGSE